MRRTDSFEKILMLGKIEEEKGTTEDEMVGWHHRVDEHGFGWTPGVGDAVQPSHPLLSPSPFAFNLLQHQGLFQ